MELEISLEHDLDAFESLVLSSPTDDLNTPREKWENGNVMHGLFQMTCDTREGTPLLECEYEQWLHLVYTLKLKGVCTKFHNKYNETPIEYLHRIYGAQNKELVELADIVMHYDCAEN